MTNKFYCSSVALEQLALYPDKYPVLRLLLLRHEDVILDITPDQLEADLNDPESSLYQLLLITVNNLTPSSAPGFQDQLELLLAQESTSALFILDKPAIVCEQLRKKFGVCVVSLHEPHAANYLMNLLACKELEMDENYQIERENETREGWYAALTEERLPIANVPLNALVITDTYLFGSKGKDIAKGTENLVGLLQSLLPPVLDGLDFHLLLIANNEGRKFTTSSFKIFATKLEKILARPYKVAIGLVTRKSGGKDRRSITSNYYFCTSQHGFNCFSGSELEYDNDFVVRGAFMGADAAGCHTPFKGMQRDLKAAKKRLASNRSLEAAPSVYPDACSRSFGFCDNRLLNLL